MSMYKKEYPEFRGVLRSASPPIAKAMWEELDKLIEYDDEIS